MSNKEQFYGPTLRGPLLTQAASKSNQWAGRTSIDSGDTTVTVSTVSVGSDDLIRIGFQSSVGSNVAQVIKVNTISPGNHFGMTVTPAPVGTDFTIMWRLDKTS